LSSPSYAWPWSILAALALSGCDTEYALPPTPCDDYCHAIQRGDCRDDTPASCVRDCEESNAAVVPAGCEQAFRARNDCLSRTAPSAFVCEDNRSRIPDICLDERRAFGECLAPGSGACFDQCLRQVEACGARLTDCEAACNRPEPGCEAASISFNTCLLEYPVECRAWLEEDPRPEQEIPCFYESLAVLACDTSSE
jgi:hypothetical protein